VIDSPLFLLPADLHKERVLKRTDMRHRLVHAAVSSRESPSPSGGHALTP